MLGDEADEALGLGELVVVKASSTPPGPASTLATPARLHSCLMPTSCSSCSVSAGSGPKRSISSAANASMSSGDSERSEAPVHLQAQVDVLDVTVRNQGGGVDRDLRRPVFRPRRLRPRGLLAREHHGFLEQVVVQLEADLLDVPRLLLAEQIAGAADVQVVRGELEAGAQLVQALDDVQPALGGLAQLLLGRQG